MAALIEAKNLKKYFETPKGVLHAVDGVSFAVEEGSTVGVVGESGCGKSTLGRTLIHLLDSTDGQIIYRGQDITHLRGRALQKYRHRMQIIFQDPNSSLDPRKTVESTIREPMKLSRRFTREEIDEQVERLMALVGVDQRMRRAYPHELDGGRRQRVGIARALAMHPEFIVCDEPVSALDVSIQAQILNLLMDLQDSMKLTYLFITHDISVVRHISDKICVMYLGQMVEFCEKDELFRQPLHPYTAALLSAVPTIDKRNQRPQILLKGELRSPIDPKPGCRFAPRCPYAGEECSGDIPLREVLPGHFVACCKAEETGGP